MASNASIAPADGPPMPCARCGVPTPPGAARACAHLLEGRLRSFRALPAASAACTLCAPADASFPLCPPCAADLLLRNVALSPGDRERGYALAPRASVLAVLDEGHEARMRPLPGALAKLGLTAVPTREDRWFERLWVAVTAPGRGEVRNEPGVFSPDVLRLGDSVEFAEEHVLRCYAPAEPSKLPKKRRKKPPREAEDGRDAKLLADVASHGFHVVHVEPNDELGIPRFSFTVGLYHTFGHPELLIRAAEMEVGQAVLTLLAESAKSTGEAAVPGGMLLEAECGLVEFPGEMYGDYLGYAGWFYGGWEFPVLELRWQEKVPVAGSDHVSGAKVE
ncbi:hypothetical protein DFJ74DRAFT_704925 [Hyaloraphidium curvatum]|nr:hypothetical protein DFJ74DRAFT_704925 [Hyaloraphidium curvatum]